MLKLKFDDIEELCKVVLDTYRSESKKTDYPSVGVYADYSIICDAANHILHTEPTIDLVFAELSDENCSGYDKEYILEIDHEGNMWLEKAYCKETGRYLSTEDSVIYLHSDCNSAILKKLDDCLCVEFCITEYDGEEDADYEHDKCCCNRQSDIQTHRTDGDVDIHTISKSETKDGSYSSITVSCTDKSLIEMIAKTWQR